MALAMTDFKKTTRTTELGRQIYPHQLRDQRYLSAIGFTINYYEQMLGRNQSDFDSNTLLEFFGDPKLARGIVACLSRHYTWYQQQFHEILSAEAWQVLKQLEITQPKDLRSLLYHYTNTYTDGFLLPDQRYDTLSDLCQTLPLSVAEFESLMQLDSPEAAILIRNGTIPESNDIIAAYNFHSLETALRHATSLTLTLSGEVWPMILSIRNLAQRYNLKYDLIEGPRDLFGQQMVITWHGKKDVFGSWSRHGRKLTRGLLRLLAAHPDCPMHGIAHISLKSRNMVLKLTPRELTTMGVAARRQGQGRQVWQTTLDTDLAQQWSRAFSKGETANWRLRRDPEPIILEQAILVPNFVAHRGTQRISVFIPATATNTQSIVHQSQHLKNYLIIAPHDQSHIFQDKQIPLITYTNKLDIKTIVAQLETNHPASQAHHAVQRWNNLEAILEAQGYISDTELADILGMRNVEEAIQAVKHWRPSEFQYVDGLGLCTHKQIHQLRQIMQNKAA